MESLQTNTNPTTQEEERQPSVASTVILTEENEICNSVRHTEDSAQEMQIITSATTSASADVSDVATVGGERLTVPSSEEPACDVQFSAVEHFLDARCPESLECLVDPAAFPNEPFQEGVDYDDTREEPEVNTRPKKKRGEKKDTSLRITAVKAKIKAEKRSRQQEDSDTDEGSDLCISQRLRSRKAFIIEDNTTTEDEVKPPPTMHMDVQSSIQESTAGEADDIQVTDEGSTVQKKKKQTRRRTSPIASKMHKLIDPESVGELPLTSMSAFAMDYLDDIDIIRVKSSIQGVLSVFEAHRQRR